MLRNGSGSQGAKLDSTETLSESGPKANAVGRGSNMEEDQKHQKDQKDQKNENAEKVELGQCEALECQGTDRDQKEVVALSHPHHIFEQDAHGRSRK